MRFSRPDELGDLWQASLTGVTVSPLDVEASYEDFDDLWAPPTRVSAAHDARRSTPTHKSSCDEFRRRLGDARHVHALGPRLVRRRVDTLICPTSIDSVAETPEELYERSKGALRTPPLGEWRPGPSKASEAEGAAPSDEAEAPQHGEGGVACWACDSGDDEFVWTSEAVAPLVDPRAAGAARRRHPLPAHTHYADPGDLPENVAAELGVAIARSRAGGSLCRRDRPRPCVPVG